MKENVEIKSWNALKNEFKLQQRIHFKWMQLVDAIQSNCKNNLKHSDTYYDITFLPLTPQAAIFGFLEANCKSYLIQSHILLILKLYMYKSRKNKFLSSTCLLKEIKRLKTYRKKLHL